MDTIARTARNNPFRVERVHTVRYEPLETTWSDLMSRLATLNFRAAICGPEGSGKTTLMEDFVQRLHAGGRPTCWLQIRRETRSSARRLCGEFLDGARADEILLVDGAEQLGAFTWRELRSRSRRHAGLVVTVHTPGRLPTLIECRTNVALLESIVARLVPNDIDRWRDDLPALFTRHHGNIRECLRALYDQHAAGRRPATVR